MTDVLLVLGAGASAPAPSALPTFDELATGILEVLGWSIQPACEGCEKPEEWVRRRERFGRVGLSFPTIRPVWREVPPEVVFGSLYRFGVPFKADLCAQFASRSPNLVHRAAANQLALEGPVWTTNVDRLIEDAYASLTVTDTAGDPKRYYRRRDDNTGVVSHGELNAHCLVKFHGTIDVPESLAFADLELLTPLPESEVGLLESIAEGRHVVVHGYRGRDLDLRGAMRRALAAAEQVTWFEPNPDTRTAIGTAFTGSAIRFLPEDPTHDEQLWQRTGEAFIEVVEASGLFPDDKGVFNRGDGDFQVLSDMLCNRDLHGWTRPMNTIRLSTTPPAIVHARLVERFGAGRDEAKALRHARWEDLCHLRIHALVPHARWAVSRSLYHEGVVATTLRIYLRHPWVLRLPGTGRLTNLAFDKGTALLLAEGDWSSLDWLTELALRSRHAPDGQPRPADLYYRSHALRYQLQPMLARQAAKSAETGLEGRRPMAVDAERLAGAVLEQGILDLYQGRFHDARSRAADLQSERGRYAIQRWPAWGYWLDGFALAYLGDLDQSMESFGTAKAYFSTEIPRAVADCVIGEMFCRRVAVAVDGTPPESGLPPEWEAMSPRQRDDVRLVLADHRLAAGDVETAAEYLGAVLRAPSNEVARWWAELGMAEIRRLRLQQGPGFSRVRDHAQRVGARWLELQALAGMMRSEELTEDDAIGEIQRDPPQVGPDWHLGDNRSGRPPILWMVT